MSSALGGFSFLNLGRGRSAGVLVRRPTNFQGNKLDAQITALSVGSTPLTYTTQTPLTIDGTNLPVIAANTTNPLRVVILKLKSSAANGIKYAFGTMDPTGTDHHVLEPGEEVAIATQQAIRATRDGASSVTLYVTEGVAS